MTVPLSDYQGGRTEPNAGSRYPPWNSGRVRQPDHVEGRMFKLTRKWLGTGLLGVIATSAMGAAPQSTSGSPQDAATAKAILSELLAIDTTYGPH